MTNSVYPNGIPVFTDHRDLLDDVKAGDINWIQHEVTAIADALGENPHIYGDVTGTTQYVTTPPAGNGDLISGGSIPQAPFTAGLNEVNYGNVSNRLDAIQRGDAVHVFSLVAGGMSIPPTTNINVSNPLLAVWMPYQGIDPYGLYNGLGVTLKKSGWYSIKGSMYLNLLGSQPQRDGAYASAVNINGYNLNAYDRERLFDSDAGGNPGSVILQPIFNGFLPSGTLIHLRVGHDSAVTHQVIRAELSGFLVREM